VTAPATSEKTLRRDAQRNRDSILVAARALLARDGVDASVEEITREAGVGMGTLYRHFPTKADLVDAVLEDAFAEIVQAAEDALAEEDAWSALTGFFEHALELHAENRGLKDALAATEQGRARGEAMRTRMRPVLAQMVARAQEQGALRLDFDPKDVPLVFWTASRVIEVTEDVAPGFWRRYVGLLFDGFRVGAATPLPRPPLTGPQLGRIAGSRS
jgi:AcrR family transcriptional regulator